MRSVSAAQILPADAVVAQSHHASSRHQDFRFRRALRRLPRWRPIAQGTAAAEVLGYACKLVIHPTQIAVINSVFTISDQIATACRVVAAFDQPGGGACQMEGRMVDVPVV
jgi:citrate lyase beta subunit